MSEKEIAIHNIALLYSIHKELHPDDTEMTLEMIAANYDRTVSEVKEILVPGKKVDLRIYSNRGPINRSVTLGNTSHYLHIRH